MLQLQPRAASAGGFRSRAAAQPRSPAAAQQFSILNSQFAVAVAVA